MAKNLLKETLDAWGYARDGVIDELENIPATDFNFRPSPHSRSAAELAAHIIESGLMASGELTRKDGNFQRQSYPEFIDELRGQSGEDGEEGRAREVAALDIRRGRRGLSQERREGDDAADRAVQRRASHTADMAESRDRARGIIAGSSRCTRLLGRVPALTKLIEGS